MVILATYEQSFPVRFEVYRGVERPVRLGGLLNKV